MIETESLYTGDFMSLDRDGLSKRLEYTVGNALAIIHIWHCLIFLMVIGTFLGSAAR